MKNARDIIAVGFKLEKTFIFSDYEYVGGPFYKNVSKISRQITLSQAKATFGFGDSYVSLFTAPLRDGPSLLPPFLQPAITLARYTLAQFRQRHPFPTPSRRSSAQSPTFLPSSHVRSTRIPTSASRAMSPRNCGTPNRLCYTQNSFPLCRVRRQR